MKAKFYIGIIAAVMFPGFMAQAQINDSRDYRNDNAGTVVNNYYNYDFYYSSRINRFHRSFLTFNYYTPLFTDSYWYNYSPNSWGLSIYGGINLGLGFSYNYPVYNDYNYNWPYFGGDYYSGYDPFYYNRWYSPIVINLGIWNRWDRNYYSWQGRNRWDYYYKPVYNNHYNDYYSDYRPHNLPSNSGNPKRSETPNNKSSNNTIPRRPGSNYTQTEITRNDKNISNNSSNNSYNVETRRGVNTSNTRNTEIVNRNTTNNNSNNRNNNNNNNNVNRAVVNPSNVQMNRRSEQIPVSNKSIVNSERQPGSVGSVNSSTRRSSSSVKSVSSSAAKKSTAKTSSRSSRRSSSKEKSKKE